MNIKKGENKNMIKFYKFKNDSIPLASFRRKDEAILFILKYILACGENEKQTIYKCIDAFENGKKEIYLYD